MYMYTVGTFQSNLPTRQPEIVDSTEKFSFLPLCFGVTAHELRKSSSGLKFNVNLLKLRWALAKFVSNLASSVKMLHTVTTSGLIKRDMMFRMRASSSLARKGSLCSGVLGYKMQRT